MKKLFAVVLAVAMLCTMAFATATEVVDDTTNMTWNNDVWAVKTYAGKAGEAIGLRLPGDYQTLEINYELFDALHKPTVANSATVDAKNFLVRVNFGKGADLVESQGFENGKYIIKLKQDYTKIEDAVADLQIDRIYISLRGSLNDHLELTAKKYSIYQEYTAAGEATGDSIIQLATVAAPAPTIAGNTVKLTAYAWLLSVDSFYSGGKDVTVTEWPDILKDYKGMSRFDIGYPVVWQNADADPIRVSYNTESVDAKGLNPWTDSGCKHDIGLTGHVGVVYGTPFGTKTSAADLTYLNAFNRAYDYTSDNYDENDLGKVQSYIVGFNDGARKQVFELYAYGATGTDTGVYEIGLTFTLNKGEYHWIQVSYDTDKAIDAIADEAEASIEYINFVGNPTFKNTVSAVIFADDDQFIYAYADGKLTDSGFKWDDAKGYWVMEGKTLSNYIVSDVELKTEAAGETNNPETGANDIVGIASALAIVSVISAAAISLKK